MEGNRKTMGVEALREIWSRRRSLAILIFAAGLAASAGVASSLPDLYIATTTVLVERGQVAEGFVRSSVTGEIETRLQSLSQRVLSRERLTDLIERHNLYPDRRGREPADVLVEDLRRDIRLEQKGMDTSAGRGSTVAFDLSFRGRDPGTVAAVANTLASFFVEENLKTRERQASGTAEFLASQLQELQSRMEEQERRIGEFKDRNMGDLPEQVGANLATLERLNAELQRNQERQARVAERVDALVRTPPPRDASDSPTAGEAPSLRLARLRRELSNLRARYSEKYPDVIRLRHEVDALEAQVAEPRSGGTEARRRPPRDPHDLFDADTRSLRDEENRLRRSIAVYQQRVESAPQREQQLQGLVREYETTKDLYTSMLKRDEEARLAGRLEARQLGEQFRILDPAVPPREPEAPDRRRLLLLGFVLSLGAAVAGIAGAERLDTSFHTMDALRAMTRVPVLAGIPRIATVKDRRRRRRQLVFRLAAALVLVVLAAAASAFVGHDNMDLVKLLARGGS